MSLILETEFSGSRDFSEKKISFRFFILMSRNLYLGDQIFSSVNLNSDFFSFGTYDLRKHFFLNNLFELSLLMDLMSNLGVLKLLYLMQLSL